MASKSPDSARRFAVSGSSKAPGTQAVVTSSGARPWRRRASSAPWSSWLVIVSLNRLQTRAIRIPVALRWPS
jgi:hypothetical protein